MLHFFSKTFLIGEYCVLEKGKAIVAVTEPRIDVALELKEDVSQIHTPYSRGPTSDLMKLSNKYFDVQIRTDNLGLGTSTAVFLSVLSQIRPDLFVPMVHEEREKKAFQILEIYLSCESNNLKVRPSGADLLAQYMGLGIWEVDLLNHKISKLNWSYENLAFMLIRTGFKTPTHTHLNHLQTVSFSELKSINNQVIEAYKNKDDASLFEFISDFSNSLDKLELLDTNTKLICDEVIHIDGVKAVKGCGAMGSDSLFLIYNSNKRQNVEQYLTKRNLTTYYDSSSSSI